ncbi:protein kinase domain-containing protein [Pirellulaceae bacterium SH449]
MMNSQPDTPNDPLNATPDSPPIDATCEFFAAGSTEEIVRVLDQYLEDLKLGRQPSRDALLAQHPAIASQLEACLAGLDFIHNVERSAPEQLPQLGDYRIIREVGRGGMGAVFEAEQISLGRRVALKVLRFGGVSDREAVDRFQREAETVAKLHHTHIVPIFAVGSEKGVNYYAMQFIEGKSLAEVVADRGAGLPPVQAAEIGLQAAEALAHAHQRGVIHRDVKPSNLLLDHENRVWLTDFGLARRLDDVTLSMTGALLGTPRYMSPEQAKASTKRIDFRSDLFSFGATLYELLSGKPAFSGENPHDVIQHIISDEPPSLRTLDNAIPRDLETIVLKCLVKDPQHRYAAASDLADDLRAFLDGRPIRARRATPVELVSRWVKQNRRSVWLSTSVAALTVLVILIGSLGRSQYHAWLQATFQLAAVRPPIVTEVFDRDDRLIRNDTLPMQKMASLAAGEYQVRLSAEGKLSQTYTMELERGQSFMATATLDNNDLFPPQSIQRTFDLVDLGVETGVVLWNEDSVALRKTHGPEFGWKCELNTSQDFCKASPGFEWPWSSPMLEYSGYGSYRYQPWVVESFVDLNGDGIGDIIAAARHQAWVIAISGSDGRVLWFAPRSSHLEKKGTAPSGRLAQSYRSGIIGKPLLMGDLDADGIADVVVTMIDVPSSPAMQGLVVNGTRWVEAISGRSGETIWRYELASHLFDLQPGIEVPYDLRWYVGASGMTSGGRGSMMNGKHLTRSRGHFERTGMHLYVPTPIVMVRQATQDQLACIAGTHLVILDPLTGRESEAPIDLGIRAGSIPQWADVDGDGFTDLVLLEAIPTTNYPGIPTAQLHVWSATKRRELWSQTLDADWPLQPNWTVESPHWPLVTDLDSDGSCEIVVPHRRSTTFGPSAPTVMGSTPWGEIVAFHGSTGRELWKQRLVSIDSQVDCFIAGPDINGDGVKEIFAATLGGNNCTVYVDALSGSDGQTLWTESFEPRQIGNSNADLVLGPLAWWNPGPDGWPHLLVQASAQQGPNPLSLLCAFSAGTGQVNHFGYSLTTARPHDLDGDGLQELLLLRSRSATRCDFGGELACLRGSGRQAWKRCGDLGEPIADMDGDGILDFVRSWGDGTLLANSGATGLPLWRNRPVPAVNSLQIIPLTRRDSSVGIRAHQNEIVDLDGDGVGDFVAIDHLTGGRGLDPILHAVSGRTGKLIWSLTEASASRANHLALAVKDINGDGQAEILWLAALDHNYPVRTVFSSDDEQLWLFVADGKTGRLLWSQSLSPAYGHSLGRVSPFQFRRVELALAMGDLNNDGVQDVLAPAINHDGLLELRALSGNDGQLLWKRTRNPDSLFQESLQNWTTQTLCDLNKDGTLEVVCVEPAPLFQVDGINQQHVQIVMLDGSDGSEIWTKETDTVFTHFHSFGDKRGQLLRPVCLRPSDEKLNVGVLLPGGDSKFVVYDYNGQVGELKLKHRPRDAEIWVCESAAVGCDLLVVLDDSGLSAVSVDQLDRPLWERQFPTKGQMKILTVRPGTSTTSPEIVLAMPATDNCVFGIDAASGETRWSCPGPIVRDLDDGVYFTLKSIGFLGNRTGAAPLLTFATAHAVECRQAVRNTSGIVSSSRTDEPQLVGEKSAAQIMPAEKDVRWQRALPWVTILTEVQHHAISFLGWGVFFSVTMVVLPCAYLITLTSNCQFSMKALLGLPIVAGVFLFSVMVTPSEGIDFRGILNRYLVGLAFAPPLVGIGYLVKFGVKGERLSLVLWICAVIAVSSLWGAIQLRTMLAQSPLLPQERLDWTGWYHILWAGYYVMSWFMVLFYLVSWLRSKVFRIGVRKRLAGSS